MKNLLKKNKYLVKYFRNNQYLTFFLQTIYYFPKTLKILAKLRFNFNSYYRFIDIISPDKTTYFRFYSLTNKLPPNNLLIKIHFLLIGFHENRSTKFFYQKKFQNLLPNFEDLLLNIENKITNSKLIKYYFNLIKSHDYNKFIKIYFQEFNENSISDFRLFSKIYHCVILSDHLEIKKYLDHFFLKNFENFYEDDCENVILFIAKYFHLLNHKSLLKIISDKGNSYKKLKNILEININFENSIFGSFQNILKESKEFIKMKDYNSAINHINGHEDFSSLFKNSYNKNLISHELNDKNKVKQNELNQNFLKDDLVVYTCMFGKYDRIPPLKNHLVSNIKFVCITDDLSIPNEGWELLNSEILDSLDSDYLKSRYFKTMPWKYFNNFSHSLYIDANYLFKNMNNLLKIIKECEEYDLGIFLHPECNHTFFELINLISSERIEQYKKINILKYLQSYQIKTNSFFYEASFIYRKHNDLNKKIFNEWWDLILKYPSRDQIFLSDLLENKSIKIKKLNKFGDARENTALLRRQHTK